MDIFYILMLCLLVGGAMAAALEYVRGARALMVFFVLMTVALMFAFASSIFVAILEKEDWDIWVGTLLLPLGLWFLAMKPVFKYWLRE